MASQTITQAISKKHQAWTMLGVVAIFFCCFGAREWDNYFLRNQSEFDLLTWNRSNAGSYHRAVYEQDHLAPVFLLTSRRSYTDSWAQPAEDPFRFEEVGVLDPGMTTLPIQLWPNYYQSDGLFGALRSALSPVLDKDGKPLPPKDVLVALTPFYFYLEPLLHDMGGKTVAEVPLARSSEGLVRDDVSMAVDDNLSLKLVRIAGLSPSTIDAMQKSRLFSIQVEELNPPGMTRDTLKNLDVSSKDYRKLADDYVLHPYWKVGKRASMPLPDPWIWDINGQVDSILPPCRLKLTFDLDVPQDGNYAFGASSTHMAKVSVDGKTAFFRDPDDPKSQIPPPANSKWIYGQGIDSWLGNAGFLANEAERRGLVGKAVFLKAGKHQLSVEQIWLSSNPAWNEVLRAVWQKPGGAIETLPLESMHPLPSGQLAGP